MKKTALLGAAGLLMLLSQPLSASQCPGLIREGRDLLAKAKLARADQDKIKALLDESQKLHNSGNHDDSVEKANEALGLLKKKK